MQNVLLAGLAGLALIAVVVLGVIFQATLRHPALPRSNHSARLWKRIVVLRILGLIALATTVAINFLIRARGWPIPEQSADGGRLIFGAGLVVGLVAMIASERLNRIGRIL